MRIIAYIFLIVLLASSNGCMTYSAVQDSKGNGGAALWARPVAEQLDEPSDGEWHPGYCALLPLTVPADIATSPVQIVVGLVFIFGNWHT